MSLLVYFLDVMSIVYGVPAISKIFGKIKSRGFWHGRSI